MITIGIDPGLDGAVAVISEGIHGNAQGKTQYNLYDIPVLNVKSGKKNKRQYNIAEMVKIISLHKYQESVVALEKVHSMPDQGVASMFSMGEGLGIWKGIVTALELPITHVTPQAWKKVMMAGMGKEKDASRQRAIQLFPQLADQLNLKKHHGRADALLIAEFLRRTS